MTWHRDSSRYSRVLELAVTALLVDESPALAF
jgi:hypothetical protein